MTPKPLTRLLRRAVASPRTYGLLRSALLVYQLVTRRPDEPDLWVLGRIPQRDDELILDIGANGGQSAIAISFIRRRARILSYEPIPSLWPELERIKKLLGDRFEFRRYALGRLAGTFSLYVPVAGSLPITTRASISSEAADQHCRELEDVLGLPTRTDCYPIAVRVGDAEELKPTAIKIDVEGAEYDVLMGLSQTIRKNRPVLILEKSQSFDSCVEFFADLDYEIMTDSGDSKHVALPGLSVRNWVACPREMTKFLLLR